MSILVTEAMQNWINHFKSTPGIVDATFSNVPMDILVPDVVTNPLLLTVTLNKQDNSGTYTARVVVPDVIYNSNNLMPVPIDQFRYIAEYNLSMNVDPGCLLCPTELIQWLNPQTAEFVPILGISHDPVDKTTVHENVQAILQQIDDIPNTTEVLLYEYIDPEYLGKFNSEHTYKVYVYFGENSKFDGNNNISFALRKETYEDTSQIPYIVDNIRTLLNEALERQG